MSRIKITKNGEPKVTGILVLRIFTGVNLRLGTRKSCEDIVELNVPFSFSTKKEFAGWVEDVVYMMESFNRDVCIDNDLLYFYSPVTYKEFAEHPQFKQLFNCHKISGNVKDRKGNDVNIDLCHMDRISINAKGRNCTYTVSEDWSH